MYSFMPSSVSRPRLRCRAPRSSSIESETIKRTHELRSLCEKKLTARSAMVHGEEVLKCTAGGVTQGVLSVAVRHNVPARAHMRDVGAASQVPTLFSQCCEVSTAILGSGGYVHSRSRTH